MIAFIKTRLSAPSAESRPFKTPPASPRPQLSPTHAPAGHRAALPYTMASPTTHGACLFSPPCRRTEELPTGHPRGRALLLFSQGGLPGAPSLLITCRRGAARVSGRFFFFSREGLVVAHSLIVVLCLSLVAPAVRAFARAQAAGRAALYVPDDDGGGGMLPARHSWGKMPSCPSPTLELG